MLFRLPQQGVRAMAGVALPARPAHEWLAERWRLVRMLPLARWPALCVLVAGLLATAVAPVIVALSVGRLVGVVAAGEGGPAGLVPSIAALGGGLLAVQLGLLVAGICGPIRS